MIAAILILLAVGSAAFAALSLRLPSAVSTMLAGYLILVANVGVVTWALSPFHDVIRTDLFAAELVLLVTASGAWWRRGRPGLQLAGARAAYMSIARDPIALLFVAVLAAALLYELVLAVTVPPNNYDSLTYHLSRAAAWKQDGGVHWIPNAPSDRLNSFQPLAEQQILFLFVAAGGGALFALPQYVAQLAILAGVYGGARRLGFDQRVSACSAALLATFTLFALEATTAQNDLVSAAFPVAAACLLLGGGQMEAFLAGAALGMGLGAKLTTLLVWPVLAWLAWMRGRAIARRTVAGAVVGFVAVGCWSFVLNLVHTGKVLGHGGGRTADTVKPSVVTDLHMILRLIYRLLDLSLISNDWIWILAGAGVAAAMAVALANRRRAAGRIRAFDTIAVALPLLTPAIILGIAPVVSWVSRVVHLPVHDPVYGFSINRNVDEDFSGFGPLGALGLIALPILVVVAYRKDRRHLALALAMPSYAILLGFYARYNIWVLRFLIVPAALTAPLFGHLLRRRAAAAAALVVAALTVTYALRDDINKPFDGNSGHPWSLTQAQALMESPAEPTGRDAAAGLLAYERQVPSGSCVGAVLDPDEWSYILWGPHLANRVYFLPSLTAVQTAIAENLRYVVISTGANAPVANTFRSAGWKIVSLANYWNLAIGHQVGSSCG